MNTMLQQTYTGILARLRGSRGRHQRDVIPGGETSKARGDGSRVLSDGASLLGRLRDDLIGNRACIQTPFGERPLIYADYTASGRSLSFLEQNIRSLVLPFYANTHTEASFTGVQTNALRESARAAIRSAVNGSEEDKVIFCGPGATTAINRLIDILGISLPRELDRQFALNQHVPASARPAVIVGPYEHHSNELPWRETIADVVRIGLNENGRIDQEALANALKEHAGRHLIIGSFSAASNVTGVRSDVAGITRQLKQAGALAFWDYAAAGPYVPIDMNIQGAAIDAVFLSPLKFIGGPGTPGVLIAKSHLLQNEVPSIVGGGTVSYVSPTEHRYLADPEHREEGGTPAIVESIRAGAVFALKEQIGAENIEAIERAKVKRALAAFSQVPEIQVLGPPDEDRLGIFSLRIMFGRRDLHHGFVASLLNDLFGIQARGGCSCAGPYGHELLEINAERSAAIDQLVSQGLECFKPGWVRVNFHYVSDQHETEYVLKALALIAQFGWRLLPAYQLDTERGSWVHRTGCPKLPVDFNDLLGPTHTGQPTVNVAFDSLLEDAASILKVGACATHVDQCLAENEFTPEQEKLRWFATPRDAAQLLLTTN
jgi:selenocysteine lyase/cysteine desulfurase